jgi:mannose-6-phosphate isomerase-like protein (cupin superfamily)
MRRRKIAILLPLMMVSPVLISLTACQSQNVAQRETIAPTPTPAVDQTQLAPDTQQNPYRQFAPGLLAKTTYKAEKTSRIGVEIWDLLVGPGKKTEAVTLPGGAVFEVRSGNGVVTVGGKPREVKTGATFSFDEGEAFQIENRSADDALSIRVVLIRGSQN